MLLTAHLHNYALHITFKAPFMKVHESFQVQLGILDISYATLVVVDDADTMQVVPTCFLHYDLFENFSRCWIQAAVIEIGFIVQLILQQ